MCVFTEFGWEGLKSRMPSQKSIHSLKLIVAFRGLHQLQLVFGCDGLPIFRGKECHSHPQGLCICHMSDTTRMSKQPITQPCSTRAASVARAPPAQLPHPCGSPQRPPWAGTAGRPSTSPPTCVSPPTRTRTCAVRAGETDRHARGESGGEGWGMDGSARSAVHCPT